MRYVPVLLGLAAYGDYCVLATRMDSDSSIGQYGLLLCNTLGTPVDGDIAVNLKMYMILTI